MLTRLKVSGFKNLVDVDLSFGPFTCIAGPNGVGKSNLFDAIRFLSALADQSFIEAALSVRDEEGQRGDVRSLFHRVGDKCDDKMYFEADIIVPSQGTDDLGQTAKAGMTFLRYVIELALRTKEGALTPYSVELTKEELKHINISDARENLRFRPSKDWIKSVIRGRRTTPFISTEGEGTSRVIKLHQDQHGGRTLNQSAGTIPRTVLSSASAENPTVLLARRELQSWRLLQLEPSALREPDGFLSPAQSRLGSDGAHLPATVYRLAQQAKMDADSGEAQVYQTLANRLQQLNEDVRMVGIDRDEKRELLTLFVRDRNATTHAARALSDGTLRFLALAVLDLDPDAQGLICLEEPENGIHPRRIPAMIELLEDIAVDTEAPVGQDNPLRQVIINTHSPAVVQQVDPAALLAGVSRTQNDNGHANSIVTFQHLPSTWRAAGMHDKDSLQLGRLLDYLQPVADSDSSRRTNGTVISTVNTNPPRRRSRVIDRSDVQDLFKNIE